MPRAHRCSLPLVPLSSLAQFPRGSVQRHSPMKCCTVSRDSPANRAPANEFAGYWSQWKSRSASHSCASLTGLLTASTVRQCASTVGPKPNRTITAMIDLPTKSYPSDKSRIPFIKMCIASPAAAAGYRACSRGEPTPLASDTWIDMARIPGDTPRPAMQMCADGFRWISPDWPGIHVRWSRDAALRR